MSAYAALNSLLRVAISEPLFKKVLWLLDFLENYSGSDISALERKMREAGNRAENAILMESFDRHLIDVTEPASRILFDPEIVPLWIFSSMLGIFIHDALFIFPTCATTLHAALLQSKNYPSEKLWRGISADFYTIEDEVIQIMEARGEEGMSCYAALIYLRQILDSNLDSSSMTHNIPQLNSLREKVIFLMSFLQEASSYAPELLTLDAEIRHAAHKAKALVQFKIRDEVIMHLKITEFYRSMKILVAGLFLVQYVLVIWKIPPPRPLNFQLIYESYPSWVRKLSFSAVRVALTHCAITMWKSVTEFAHEIWATPRGQENQELHLVIDDLNIIERKVIEIKDACRNSSGMPPPAASSRRGVKNSVVVGLGSDLDQIRTRLVQDHSSERQLVSIVGMGGIGKSTLAKLVYHDSGIVSHFDLCAWVTVSQEYSLRRVILGLLDSANVLTKEMQDDDENELGVHLHKNLMSRRYLMVIDDVWDTQIWDFVSRFFPENYNGSCVLLTTRLSNVASYIDSSRPVHKMRCLNEDDSWYLLRVKVFGGGSCPSELESIGREIARNCRGLPLAIVVIGGLLYKDNQNRRMWLDVLENINSKLRENDEDCLEILGLSYKHLPHRLRPCFLYMGVFPRDSEIPVSRLTKLWVAEGFLRPYLFKSLEMEAEDCLQELIDRNLISVCKRSCNGKIRTCSIHDLLRVVSWKNAKEEKFLYNAHFGHGRALCRLTIDLDARNANVRNYLCSFICVASKPINDSSAFDLGFLYLRVLDVLEVHFGEFPDQIVNLVHLRYLAFHSDGPLSPLISNLGKLETLVYHHCLFHNYPLLPWVIWRMPNLRHLYAKSGFYLFHPWRTSQLCAGLQHLQTLVGIVNFTWVEGITKRFPNLKKLGISYEVSSFVDWSTYQLESLVDLHKLETLKIIIKYNDDLGFASSREPPKLAFPQQLKKLSLSGSGIPWANMTTIGSLPNLEALKLRCEACYGPSWETVEGEFPRLVFLLLEQMSFRWWGTGDASHFPRLQRLVVRSCGMLEEIPCAIGDIPTLEVIELVDCQSSLVDSAKQIQEEQENMGNDELKVCIGLKGLVA